MEIPKNYTQSEFEPNAHKRIVRAEQVTVSLIGILDNPDFDEAIHQYEVLSPDGSDAVRHNRLDLASYRFAPDRGPSAQIFFSVDRSWSRESGAQQDKIILSNKPNNYFNLREDTHLYDKEGVRIGEVEADFILRLVRENQISRNENESDCLIGTRMEAAIRQGLLVRSLSRGVLRQLSIVKKNKSPKHAVMLSEIV